MHPRLILAFVLVTTLTACVGPPRLRAHVEAFSTLAVAPTPATVTITALPPADASSLEFQAYAQKLEAFLARRGFTVVDEDVPSAWRLSFGYGGDDGRTVVDSYNVRRDRWPGSNLRTAPYHPGWYGYPYETRVISRVVFTRWIVLTLASGATGEEAWRTRVRNVSGCPSFAPLVDPLLAAAFENFPEPGPRTLDVALEGGC